jgi:ribosomal protein S18 acetylase RimI-like enzyme
VDVNEQNADEQLGAQRFYEAMGFVVVGQSGDR